MAAFSTSAKPVVKPEADPVGNEAVAPEFTNRNPRNLELLAVARKERGWGTKAMTNLDSILKSRDITLSTKVHQSRLWFFQWSCMDVRVGL